LLSETASFPVCGRYLRAASRSHVVFAGYRHGQYDYCCELHIYNVKEGLLERLLKIQNEGTAGVAVSEKRKELLVANVTEAAVMAFSLKGSRCGIANEEDGSCSDQEDADDDGESSANEICSY